LDYIVRVGFLDSSILGSDHKGLFADLNTAGITGEGKEGKKKPQLRNQRHNEPIVSASYQKILHKQFEHHNVYRRLKKLQEEANEKNWNIVNEQRYERIDKDTTAAMHHAEKTLQATEATFDTVGKLCWTGNECHNILGCQDTTWRWPQPA
jgi:hypothetical protein